MPKHDNTSPKSFRQSDGIVEIETKSFHTTVTQVSLATDSTSGLVEVKAKYHPLGHFETLYEDDGQTPLVLDLTKLKTFQLKDKWVFALQFEPSDVDASYTPLISTGEM